MGLCAFMNAPLFFFGEVTPGTSSSSYSPKFNGRVSFWGVLSTPPMHTYTTHVSPTHVLPPSPLPTTGGAAAASAQSGDRAHTHLDTRAEAEEEEEEEEHRESFIHHALPFSQPALPQ